MISKAARGAVRAWDVCSIRFSMSFVVGKGKVSSNEKEGERLIDRSIMQTRLGEAFGVNTYWMAFRSWMVEISDISIDFSCCFSWRGGIVVLMDGWIRHASLNLPYKSSHIRNSDSMAVFQQMPLMRRTGELYAIAFKLFTYSKCYEVRNLVGEIMFAINGFSEGSLFDLGRLHHVSAPPSQDLSRHIYRSDSQVLRDGSYIVKGTDGTSCNVCYALAL